MWTAGPAGASARLPPSFEEFLKTIGALAVHDSTVSGIVGGDVLEERTGSIYGDTRRYRKAFALPNRFLVIQADEDAPYCFDCECVGEYGDCVL